MLGADSEHQTVLEAVLQEPALGQGATVWLVEEGTAKNLLETVEGGAKRLSSIELNSGVEPVTVLQSVMRLEEFGRVELPTLNLEEDVLNWSGTELVREVVYGA